MTLPWNRGGEEDRIPGLVDLLPVVGGSTGGSSRSDREAASEPVLVAPHRDPGEDAVNHDLPPGYESARKREAASAESPTPAAESDARSSAPEPPDPSPAPDRTTDEMSPAGVRRDAGGPDPSSANATPSPVTLESVVGDAARSSSTAAEPASTPDGTDDAGTGDASDDVSDDRADDVDDRGEESGETDDRSDTVPVNGG